MSINPVEFDPSDTGPDMAGATSDRPGGNAGSEPEGAARTKRRSWGPLFRMSTSPSGQLQVVFASPPHEKAATTNGTSMCTKCGTETCLPLVRAHNPPKGILDFLDRQHMLFTGHWRANHVAYVAALVGIFVIGIIAIAEVGPILGMISGILTSTGVIGGRALWRWVRKRHDAEDIPPPTPIGGPHLSNVGDPAADAA